MASAFGTDVDAALREVLPDPALRNAVAVAMMRYFGGAQVYVPRPAPSEPAVCARVAALDLEGRTVREIQMATGISSTAVYNILREPATNNITRV